MAEAPEIAALRSRVASVRVGAGERAAAWRFFLGVCPTLSGQGAAIASSRRRYAARKSEELPDVSEVSSAGDPLSGLLGGDGGGGAGGGGGWDKYHANVELRCEIDLDLERLVVAGVDEDHFRAPARAAAMRSVLLVWASAHPAVGYRQGMHEVLAVFALALEAEGGGSLEEGDAYALFAACLETHAELFAVNRGADAPILALYAVWNPNRFKIPST